MINEYAKPIIPNDFPRIKIPITKIIIEVKLEITRNPLFSFANSCAENNEAMVEGTIAREIIGINSRDSEYSGKKNATI